MLLGDLIGLLGWSIAVCCRAVGSVCTVGSFGFVGIRLFIAFFLGRLVVLGVLVDIFFVIILFFGLFVFGVIRVRDGLFAIVYLGRLALLGGRSLV